MSREIELTIPEHYVWMTEGYKNRTKLFKQYVDGYIRNSYPNLTLVRIEKMKAICERRYSP